MSILRVEASPCSDRWFLLASRFLSDKLHTRSFSHAEREIRARSSNLSLLILLCLFSRAISSTKKSDGVDVPEGEKMSEGQKRANTDNS